MKKKIRLIAIFSTLISMNGFVINQSKLTTDNPAPKTNNEISLIQEEINKNLNKLEKLRSTYESLQIVVGNIHQQSQEIYQKYQQKMKNIQSQINNIEQKINDLKKDYEELLNYKQIQNNIETALTVKKVTVVIRKRMTNLDGNKFVMIEIIKIVRSLQNSFAKNIQKIYNSNHLHVSNQLYKTPNHGDSNFISNNFYISPRKEEVYAYFAYHNRSNGDGVFVPITILLVF